MSLHEITIVIWCILFFAIKSPFIDVRISTVPQPFIYYPHLFRLRLRFLPFYLRIFFGHQRNWFFLRIISRWNHVTNSKRVISQRKRSKKDCRWDTVNQTHGIWMKRWLEKVDWLVLYSRDGWESWERNENAAVTFILSLCMFYFLDYNLLYSIKLTEISDSNPSSVHRSLLACLPI